MNGRILIDRQLLTWEWWDDNNVLKLWIYILVRANWQDEKWHGQIIPRGSFVTSYEQLSKATGLTISQVRTALRKLTSTGEISQKTTNKNQMIVVEKYDFYQDISTIYDNQIANKSQTNDNQIANKSQQMNKDNKNNKNNKENKYIYGEYGNVKLTETEFEKLHTDFPELADTAIKFLDEYIEDKPSYKSKSHYLAIRRWVIDAVKEKRGKSDNPFLDMIGGEQ